MHSKLPVVAGLLFSAACLIFLVARTDNRATGAAVDAEVDTIVSPRAKPAEQSPPVAAVEQPPDWPTIIKTQRGGYELILIPGGKFLMGSPPDEAGRKDEEGPQHQVTLGPFYMGKHEVTNAQYGEYLRANPEVEPPALWTDEAFNRPDQPVVGVSWEDSSGYCRWAGLHLPTEAQWEYATRAGSTTRFWNGDGDDQLAEVGWFVGNSGGHTHAVGQKPANPWGLHDVHGNVLEWCLDPYHYYNYYVDPQRDSRGLVVADRDRNTETTSPVRAYRGGSAGMSALVARSAYRNGFVPTIRRSFLGFRAAALSPSAGTDASTGVVVPTADGTGDLTGG